MIIYKEIINIKMQSNERFGIRSFRSFNTDELFLVAIYLDLPDLINRLLSYIKRTEYGIISYKTIFLITLMILISDSTSIDSIINKIIIYIWTKKSLKTFKTFKTFKR